MLFLSICYNFKVLTLFAEIFLFKESELPRSYGQGFLLIPEMKKYGKYKFKEVLGEGIFEVLVGPVYAGIIEPGHFRFSLAGEPVLQLEIRHFWKHRGIEKVCEGKDFGRQ